MAESAIGCSSETRKTLIRKLLFIFLLVIVLWQPLGRPLLRRVYIFDILVRLLIVTPQRHRCWFPSRCLRNYHCFGRRYRHRLGCCRRSTAAYRKTHLPPRPQLPSLPLVLSAPCNPIESLFRPDSNWRLS